MLRFFVGIFFALSLSLYSEVWTDCSEAFETAKPGTSHEERQKIAQKARLVGDTVAFLASRDVASADSAGRIAVENNFAGIYDLDAVPSIDVIAENADNVYIACPTP